MKTIKRDEFLQVNFSLQCLSFPPPPRMKSLTANCLGNLLNLSFFFFFWGGGVEEGNLRWIVHSIQGK